MNKTAVFVLTLAGLGSLCRAQEPGAIQFRLPAIFSDHMVLQADQPDPVWGWAPAGITVQIDFEDGQGKSMAQAGATAGADGRWSTKLPSLAPGTAGQLKVTAGTEIKTVQDVLVGEAWLCSGQSNMGYFIGEKDATPQILAAAHKEAAAAQGAIRYFEVVKNSNNKPLDDVRGMWFVVTPENVEACSSVAWNFAVALREKLPRPVGLIIAAMGGTPAEAWMPKAVVDGLAVGPSIEQHEEEEMKKHNPGAVAKFDQELAAWFKANPTPQGELQNIKSQPREPHEPRAVDLPGRFYNAMIHGLEPYGIKGVLWYQGGENTRNYQDYPELIRALIQYWRKAWGAELPFYYVELSGKRDMQTAPVDNDKNLALIREAQGAALDLPKTDVVTAVDLGGTETITDPHFANKKPLGQRLGNIALTYVYGMNLGEVDSPRFAGFKVEGNTIRLKFDHAGGLRVRGGGALKGFAIRGDKGPWAWADGVIQGAEIVVSSKQVPQPVAVRYAWAANPILSIENGVGLPLLPFRTDKDSTQDSPQKNLTPED